MFTIKHIVDPIQLIEYFELKNSDNSSYAKIDLLLGGSLQECKLSDKTIISSKQMPSYSKTYASAILFPFANRIENGSYHFHNKVFKLSNNEAKGHNALHGLVYNKSFKLIDQVASENRASITVSYEEIQPISGFPYKYGITLHYVLTNNSLELIVDIANNDQNEFPFSLGWHPYFIASDLHHSFLNINSDEKILVNEKMIPNGTAQINWTGSKKIRDVSFDDCFILNTNMVEFKTPEYHIDFSFSPHKNYLQLYTPYDRKSMAIEPQTAPANSFNTQKGLQILHPNERFNLSWKIKLK